MSEPVDELSCEQALHVIKFRGKRVGWVYGYYYVSNTLSGPVHYIRDCFNESHVVDPSTVGQYSGIKDFYAGDIVRNPRGAIGIIAWHSSWCGFYFKKVLGYNENKELVKMSSSVQLYNDLPKYEKLGNMHDNPELLGGKGGRK